MPELKKEDIELARQPTYEGLVRYYDLIFSDRGWTLPLHMHPVAEALADFRIRQLMLIIGPGSGKSLFLSTVYPSWLLGLDQSQTVLNIGVSEGLPVGFAQSVMEIIEWSDMYHLIFPEVKPAKALGWSPGAGLYITGRKPGIPDPSYAGFGMTSKALVGKHGRTLILDDLHDMENTQNPDQIDKVVMRYNATIRGRQDPTGARFIVAGRRWAEKDLYGVLMAENDWVVMTLPAYRPKENNGNELLYYDLFVPEGMDCAFSTKDRKGGWRRWAYSRAEPDESEKELFYWPQMPNKKTEVDQVRKSKPALFKAIYQGDPTDSEGRVFRAIDFRYGTFDLDMMRELGGIVIQSWDTAFSAQIDADYSVCITAVVMPCKENHRGEEGECEDHWDVYVIDVFRKQLDFSDLIDAISEMNNRFRPEEVLIEKKATGVPAISLLKNKVPFHPVDPGGLSKRVRATNGAHAGSTQGWFRLGRVVFLAGTAWLDTFEIELEHFTGKQGDTDDQVDALVYLVNNAIDLSRSEGMIASESERMIAELDKRNSMGTNELALDEIIHADIFNPFESSCSACRYFVKEKNRCSLHNMVTHALNYCEYHETESIDAPLGYGSSGNGGWIGEPVQVEDPFDLFGIQKNG